MPQQGPLVSLFKMTSKHSAENLPGVPECRKAMVHLMKQTRMLDEFSSGTVIFSVVGCELHVNESKRWFI